MDSAAVATAVSSVSRAIAIEQQGLAAILGALDAGLAAAFARAAAVISAATGTVIVTGMGKSGHIGRKIAATLASTGTPSHFVHPGEASHGDLGVIRDNDVVLALSWSGESPELADIVAYTRRFGVPLVAITSRPDSALGSAADICLALPKSPEACPNGLAPTTSTTMQLVAGDALSIFLLEQRKFSAEDFHQFHPGGKLGAKLLQVHALMHTGDELPIVPTTASLSDGIMEMTSKRFGVTAVVDDGGKLAGILTDGDLRRAFKKGFVDQPVQNTMGKRPYTLPPEALAMQALAIMNDAKITCIFVVDNKKPVGLVHIHDLLKAGIA
ncbi:KpsF/GutQ family sugar-phosphate isomerase [Acidisoma silvae]|uniref:KpsF/GutQ family sugar-phosphate isomerase n=1 Tax=Acidisoma silvae TaxID=2802396 RepID=A0A963YN29_9PROT|nr:KpsF/GutQ family sugar-phosphate isomerase [Acidisoma silvae]